MAATPLTWDGTDAQGNSLRWDSTLTWDGTLPQSNRRMPQLRVLLSFAQGPDMDLHERAQAVHDNLYTSPLWTVPPNPVIPVTAVNLAAASTAFTAAIAAADQGGPPDTALKNDKRDALIDLLRHLANYVQENHGNDLAKLLASGFEAASTSNASGPLDAPTIKDILNSGSGQLTLRIGAIANAKCYEVRYALIGSGGTPGPWQSAPLFTSSRGIIVTGLTPGGNYTFQIRAVGGSTGYSEWSDAVSHMSL